MPRLQPTPRNLPPKNRRKLTQLKKRMKLKANHGLSLIGVLVALFLLVIIVLTLSQLTVSTEKVARLSRDRFTAVNVAREGLELVHAMRDNNWRAEEDWATDLCDGTNLTNSFTLDRDGVRDRRFIGDSDTTSQQLFVRDDGHWTHASTNAAVSRFSRLLTIDCTCAVAGDCTDPDETFIVATATVTWQVTSESEETLTVSTKLYDWFRTPEPVLQQ